MQPLARLTCLQEMSKGDAMTAPWDNDELVERVAVALAQDRHEDFWRHQEICRQEARAALRAITDNPCDFEGCDQGYLFVDSDQGEPIPVGDCPRCHGSGLDPSPPAWMLEMWGQVGWYSVSGGHQVTDQMNDDDVPMYRWVGMRKDAT